MDLFYARVKRHDGNPVLRGFATRWKGVCENFVPFEEPEINPLKAAYLYQGRTSRHWRAMRRVFYLSVIVVCCFILSHILDLGLTIPVWMAGIAAACILWRLIVWCGRKRVHWRIWKKYNQDLLNLLERVPELKESIPDHISPMMDVLPIFKVIEQKVSRALEKAPSQSDRERIAVAARKFGFIC